MNKLYDFNDKHNHCSHIGRQRLLAWPCRMYRVTLPQSKHNAQEGLNLFELCILKLLACGRYEPKDLAYETCLPPDLIKIILLRLYDMGKIDHYNQLTSDTLKELEKYESKKESEPTEYETRIVFQECITGTLLPMLVDAKLQAEEIDEEGRIVGRKRKPWQLYTTDRHDFKTPTSSDVRFAINTMFRRSKMTDESYSIPRVNYISVATQYESCFLLACMVLQTNGDWRILNPFGKSWSLELESAYQEFLNESKKEEEVFQQWYSENIDIDSQKNNSHDSDKKELFETQENYNRYPELIHTLKRDTGKKNGEKVGADVYSAIEWALFYALKECESTSKWVQLLQVGTTNTNNEQLKEAIRNLAISNSKGFRPSVIQEKLTSFQKYETAEMSVVLPLAILVSDDNHKFAFNQICANYPDILLRISTLKENRDKSMHGKSYFSKIYGKDDYIFMQDVITTLLPSVRFTDSTSAKLVDNNEFVDIQLQARFNLQGIFGVSLFEQMDNILQRKLIDIEIFRNNNVNGDIDVLPCIVHLYTAVQCAFRSLLMGDNSVIENPMVVAQQKANNVGWGELPDSISSVRSTMVRDTMEGKDQTLGACVIVWLCRTEEEMLFKIAKNQPDLLNDLHTLLTKRSHGNKSIKMRKEELDTLVEKFYSILRTILEA